MAEREGEEREEGEAEAETDGHRCWQTLLTITDFLTTIRNSVNNSGLLMAHKVYEKILRNFFHLMTEFWFRRKSSE